MENITENLRNTNITVSLHEKNNIYQAVINYKDDNNKRKQKWVSTGIKVARGNKRLALQKAEEYREQFEKSFNLQERIKKENDEQVKKYMLFRKKLHMMDSRNYYDENIFYFDYLRLWIEKVLRRSEVLGLKWSAIDFENKTITIKHTIVEVKIKGKNRILGKDRTKTNASHRTLPLTDEIIVALETAKKQQKYYKRKFKKSYNTKYEEYVCLNPDGSIIKPDYVTRHFPLLLKNSGLRHIRFHDLRHSCASLLLARNVPMKAIQEWLGHSDFSTTANVYAHLDINSKLLSAEAISSAFSFKN